MAALDPPPFFPYVLDAHEELSERFDVESTKKGQAFVVHGRVLLPSLRVEKTSGRLHVKCGVKGSHVEPYTVELGVQQKGQSGVYLPTRMTCTCTTSTSGVHVRCKHVAAVLLLLGSRGWGTDETQPPKKAAKLREGAAVKTSPAVVRRARVTLDSDPEDDDIVNLFFKKGGKDEGNGGSEPPRPVPAPQTPPAPAPAPAIQLLDDDHISDLFDAIAPLQESQPPPSAKRPREDRGNSRGTAIVIKGAPPPREGHREAIPVRPPRVVPPEQRTAETPKHSQAASPVKKSPLKAPQRAAPRSPRRRKETPHPEPTPPDSNGWRRRRRDANKGPSPITSPPPAGADPPSVAATRSPPRPPAADDELLLSLPPSRLPCTAGKRSVVFSDILGAG